MNNTLYNEKLDGNNETFTPNVIKRSGKRTLETVSGRSLKQAPIPLRVGVIDLND